MSPTDDAEVTFEGTSSKAKSRTIHGVWGAASCSTLVRGTDGKTAVDGNGNVLWTPKSVISPPGAAGGGRKAKSEEACTGLIKDSRVGHVSWLYMYMY